MTKERKWALFFPLF